MINAIVAFVSIIPLILTTVKFFQLVDRYTNLHILDFFRFSNSLYLWSLYTWIALIVVQFGFGIAILLLTNRVNRGKGIAIAAGVLSVAFVLQVLAIGIANGVVSLIAFFDISNKNPSNEKHTKNLADLRAYASGISSQSISNQVETPSDTKLKVINVNEGFEANHEPSKQALVDNETSVILPPPPPTKPVEEAKQTTTKPDGDAKSEDRSKKPFW